MNKYEYRVVWKRFGFDRKTKRYATLPGAQRRVRLLGPEPWTALGVDPDEKACCSGHECGCGGLTYREQMLADRNGRYYPTETPMPECEYIRIERRLLSPWESLE